MNINSCPQERSFAVLKLLDRRYSSLSSDLLNESARAMQNNLCPYLLSLDNSDDVLREARSSRSIEMERRRQQFEEFHRRDFEQTFNFDEWADAEETNDKDDDEEVAILSQALSSQGL